MALCGGKHIVPIYFMFVGLMSVSVFLTLFRSLGGLLSVFVSFPGYNCNFDPPHEKTKKYDCAPSIDSDQAGIRLVWSVFAVRSVPRKHST